ncbi:MAG: glycosyltransferase family 2 protein [Bacteroidales bacterium]|nr:glycosyltransferase family 2 protein [Bacteroidales bacterium]
MNKILVIVVTYNGMKWVDRCFGSLRTSEVSADVLAVDNGSTDGTQQYLRDSYPEVKLIETGKNLGFGRANNIGFRYALQNDYDFVYLLNEDAWVMPDTLGKLIDSFPNSRYGIVSPMQMAATMDKMDPRFEKHCSASVTKDGEVVDVRFVMAAHWMISAECLRAVGGFSPTFKHYGEDENYIHRARYHGFKVGVVKDAYAVHDRAKRKDSRMTALKLKRVSCLVRLSDPNNDLPAEAIYQPLRLIAMSIRNLSMYLLASVPHLLAKYPDIFLNRRISFSDGAFLEEHE